MRNFAPFFDYKVTTCEPKNGVFFFQVAHDCKFQLQYVTFDYVQEVINLDINGAEVSRDIFDTPKISIESLQSSKALQTTPLVVNLIDAEAGHTVYNSAGNPKSMNLTGKHKYVTKKLDFWFEKRETIKISIDAGKLPIGYSKIYIHCLLQGIRHYDKADF